MSTVVRNEKGAGKVTTIVFLLILAGAIYIGFKFFNHYYAYWDLQSTMRYWAEVVLRRGDRTPSEMIEKLKETIGFHQIPLKVGDIEIDYRRDGKYISVYAQYDVWVNLLGYEFPLHFEPHAEVQTDK
jgi:hypothetical protein